MKLALLVIGVVLFIEGLPYLASPDGVKRVMTEIQRIDSRLLRAFGFFAMAGGLLLVWLGTKMI